MRKHKITILKFCRKIVHFKFQKTISKNQNSDVKGGFSSAPNQYDFAMTSKHACVHTYTDDVGVRMYMHFSILIRFIRKFTK